MRSALIIVDVQNDFCEGGALPVQGGAQVAEDITTYLMNTGHTYDLIVASRDWHEPYPSTNDGHFAAFTESPDFKDTWPSHCVMQTEGAEYHKNLILPTRTVHVVKGMGKAAYSAFEGRLYGMPEETSLTNYLMAEGVNEVHVVGLALDYCVAATATHARSVLQADVAVLTSLTAGISAASSIRAMTEMSQYGIAFH